MKSSLKKIKDCRFKLSIEVDSKLADERYGDVLKDFQKQARLPGFREGKAPLEMVEKRFQKEAEEEVLKTLIPEAYHRSITEQKISPVTLPSISEVEWQRGKKLTFSAEFEKSPEFSLKNYKGIKITKVSAEVDESELEKSLSSLLDSKAELLPVTEARPVQKGDYIAADIDIWMGDAYKPGRKNVLLAVEPSTTDDFFEKIVGAQPEEMREISVDPTPEDKKAGLVGRKPLYRVTVRTINTKRQPALDVDFAKGFGKETVEELREAVRKDVAAHKKSESFQKMKDELFDKLLTLVNFALPEELVEKQKERLLEQALRQYQTMGMPPQSFEEKKSQMEADVAEKAKNQVKLYFILQKVAEEESLAIDEVELEQKITALAERSKKSVEEVRQVFEEDLRESMKEAKTVDFLLANAKLQEANNSKGD